MGDKLAVGRRQGKTEGGGAVGVGVWAGLKRVTGAPKVGFQKAG